MVEIKQQLVPQSRRTATYGTGNPKKKMVVHQTGNTATGANARMHAQLQINGWGASWHIQSDDKEIIQSWPLNYRLWHASTGRAANGGNMVGIGWEICINRDGDYLKSLELAAKGIAQVMKQENIPMSGLTTHNAEDPRSKWCPAQILSGQQGVTWAKFKQMVQKAYDGQAVSAPSKPTPKPKKTNEQVAREVLDGKWGNNPRRRNDLQAAGYNYNTIQGIVNQLASGSAPKQVTKSINQLAQEVIDGKHGTGDARKRALGSQYNAVQKRVNQILGAGGSSKKSIDRIAREVIDGKWGNDPERSRKLRNAGYDANAVQRRVNQLL